MKTNFNILVIVAINQIFSFQSSSGGFLVELTDEENAKVTGKAKEVGHFLSLIDITKLPAESEKTSRTIKQCYDENMHNYELMIRFFTKEIIDEVNDLKKVLNGKLSQQVNAVEEQLKNLADTLSGYPYYLSHQLSNFNAAIKTMTRKSFGVKKHVERFYVAFMDIEKAEKKKADYAMRNFNTVLSEMEAVSANTVTQIKTCMGEDEPFVPIKHIDDPINI